MTGLQHDSAVVQRETFAPIVYVLKFNVSFGSTVIQLTNKNYYPVQQGYIEPSVIGVCICMYVRTYLY